MSYAECEEQQAIEVFYNVYTETKVGVLVVSENEDCEEVLAIRGNEDLKINNKTKEFLVRTYSKELPVAIPKEIDGKKNFEWEKIFSPSVIVMK